MQTTNKKAPTIFPNVTGIKLSIIAEVIFIFASCSAVKLEAAITSTECFIKYPFDKKNIFATQCS